MRWLDRRSPTRGAATRRDTRRDAEAFVLSENVIRRHLTVGQRSMIAEKLANLENGQTAGTIVPAVTQEHPAGRPWPPKITAPRKGAVPFPELGISHNLSAKSQMYANARPTSLRAFRAVARPSLGPAHEPVRDRAAPTRPVPSWRARKRAGAAPRSRRRYRPVSQIRSVAL